jgi:adenylate cyclase
MTKYLIPFLLLVLLGLPLIYEATPTEVLKLKTFDALIPEQEPSGYFTVLNITDDDINREGGYPLSRQRLAEIQKKIIDKGGIGVGWVVTFPNKGRLSTNGDKAFADSLAQIPSVLAMFENDKGIYPKTTGTVILGEDVGGTLATGVTQNIPILANSTNQGIAVARPEVDSLVRRIPLLLRTPDGFVPAFGTEVLKILAGASTYVIKTNDNGLEEIRVRGLPPVPVDSLGRKWISFVNTPQTDLKEMDVKDKFVFIGFTAKGIMPQLSTPVGYLEPHKIQAALAESILIEGSPYVPDYALAVEVGLFTFSVLFVWLLLHLFGITWGVVFFSITMSSTAYYGYWTIQQGVLIDVTWTLISQFITGAVAFYLRFREQYKLRQQIKKNFEHYLDPRQVAKLSKNPELLKLGGDRRRCTFLFTDVRGFTSLSEKLEPEEVTEIMNKTLTIQSDAVKKYGGMVDKYIGDAMMAIFNAPVDLPNHEEKAVLAALEIMENMKDSDLGIEIGLGINTGDAVIGNLGSETRFDYTAIGDAVNLAARLESATKETDKNLLIGEATAEKINIPVHVLMPIRVKGKAEPINIYSPIHPSV